MSPFPLIYNFGGPFRSSKVSGGGRTTSHSYSAKLCMLLKYLFTIVLWALAFQLIDSFLQQFLFHSNWDILITTSIFLFLLILGMFRPALCSVSVIALKITPSTIVRPARASIFFYQKYSFNFRSSNIGRYRKIFGTYAISKGELRHIF